MNCPICTQNIIPKFHEDQNTNYYECFPCAYRAYEKLDYHDWTEIIWLDNIQITCRSNYKRGTYVDILLSNNNPVLSLSYERVSIKLIEKVKKLLTLI